MEAYKCARNKKPAVNMEDGGECEVAHMCAKGAREMLHFGAPFWDYLDKRVVVNQTYIETLTTVFYNIPDGEVLVGLIQVIAGSCAETLPRPRVLIKFNMDPEDWFIVFGETAIIEEVFLDKLAVVILFLDINCFLVFVINEPNQHNKEVSDC